MARLDESEIFDAGQLRPSSFWKRVKNPDGEDAIEKRPAGRWKKYVDAAGNCKMVKLTTAAAIRRDPAQEAHVHAVQLKAGGFVYGECPLRSNDALFTEEDFPPGLQEPCRIRLPDGRPAFGDFGACPHVEHIIKERQRKNAAYNTERENLRKREELRQEKREAMAEEQNAMMRELLSKVADKLGDDKLGDDKPRGKK